MTHASLPEQPRVRVARAGRRVADDTRADVAVLDRAAVDLVAAEDLGDAALGRVGHPGTEETAGYCGRLMTD